ncbi:MAG: DUF294 nucleotidyltransferase-like domain-containing protein [Pyrinomonadaceae bacterium]|nr:DUF294 nucleotidyltransferase-like domain-containing protein [Pyrinomonadaceae bacterium]
MIDEVLFKELPDPQAARRFIDELGQRHSSHARKLLKNRGLLSDILTIASNSPLLATTLLQHPEYIWWLNRKRSDSVVRGKEELLESLARFALTNSQVDTHDLLARFRRRELMRIFLRDIRRLVTISEITEEISNLSDAILEHALRVARQELDNRYGSPLETDEKGRQRPAEICIVSLGKLGSRELNYSSDIDLLFLYSNEGSTSGIGSRGTVSNREYFIKLAETIVRIIGHQSGEGSAYRVDLRLRPHGRVGPLALSVSDTVRYYRSEAKAWERQVLIRSRSSAGSENLFKSFCSETESVVFSTEETIENALQNVKASKQKIDLNQIAAKGTDVKLGVGGIREIEFIAQALQLAYGGTDTWLRSPHTLIALSRLADRKLLSERELTQLSDAYTFLRQLEHILQMENGLQTHLIPNDESRRTVVAAKMRCADLIEFDAAVKANMSRVNAIFHRVFDGASNFDTDAAGDENLIQTTTEADRPKHGNGEKRDIPATVEALAAESQRLAVLIDSKPFVAADFSDFGDEFQVRDYESSLFNAVSECHDFASQLSTFRNTWSGLIFEIMIYDLAGRISLKESKSRQTALAEASIATAMQISGTELSRRFGTPDKPLPLAVMGLGKIGGAGVDYDSDLDLVIVCSDDANHAPPIGISAPEYLAKAVEIFTNVLSAMTRDGSLYRVDLRLRPFGKDGNAVISRSAFLEYMQAKAAIWELLAFVKLRAVGGDLELAAGVEKEIRSAIHERAASIDPKELARETRRVRLNLEKQKTEVRHSRDIDIKFGPGGMLDIYFAIRFLQLRDKLPDTDDSRSTDSTLSVLYEAGSITRDQFNTFQAGYRFLSLLDHNLRLAVGRSTRLPMANRKILAILARKAGRGSIEDFLADVNSHRIAIRDAFDSIVA